MKDKDRDSGAKAKKAKKAKEAKKAKKARKKRKKDDDARLDAVADALSDAAAAVESGEMAVPEEEEPTERGSIRAVYGASYCISFGVVFPALMLASVVPTDNPFGHGLIDGVQAAKDRAGRMRARREAKRFTGPEAASDSDATLAPA